MPTDRSTAVPVRASKAPAPSEELLATRAHRTAAKLLTQAVDLMAAGTVGVTPEAIRSAGFPVRGGRTMIEAQKFRVNWYGMPRTQLGPLARLVTERNWLVSAVHPINVAIWGEGFQFTTPEARIWAGEGAYPFVRIHDDMVEEWLISNAVAAYWFKNPPSGVLPYIEVPDMESVEHSIVGGVEQITVKVAANPKLDPAMAERIGQRLFDAITKNKPLTIIKGEADYDFEVLKLGKSGSPLPPPSITGILDDLDFIEAVRVGDWNGAYSRREIIRHTTKGYGVSSGPNAGTARNNAKYKELQAILRAMNSIMGKTDMATNFDQDVKWVGFPTEFFSDTICAEAIRRLVLWGGLPAAVLLKTDAQIAGVTAILHERTRVAVEKFRSRFGPFLSRIFNAESFKGKFPDSPRLDPVWSVKSLYSTDSLLKLVTAFSNGIQSPQSTRAMCGIDDAAESALMREAHLRREDFTPPYEPRQGLLPSLFPQDYGDGTTPPAAPATTAAPEGKPGRPAKST